VKIFRNIAGTWTQLGSDLFGPGSSDYMGTSVSLSEDGNTIAVSYEVDVSQGKVQVYQYSGGSWSQVGSDLVGEASGDKFGYSVSLSNNGSKLAVGAYGNSSSTGHARVFENSGGTWTQIGSDIDGEASGDESGRAVALSGDGNTVIIGAPENASAAGHARVYITCGANPGIVVYFRPSGYGANNISTDGGSDGSIRTMLIGGTAPYTYTWTGPTSVSGDSGTGLTEGSYFLEVSGVHGCKGTGGPWYLSEPLPVPP